MSRHAGNGVAPRNEGRLEVGTRPPWLGIELRHLAALSAIAREQSFRGAADALGYVQSAVSQQLAHLERLVGVRLVERERGIAPVRLTEAGELMLHHGDEILARFAAAQADMGALRDGRLDLLRVGVDQCAATRLIPRILPTFASRLADVSIQMEESGSASDLAAQIEAGDLDVAFGDLPLPPGPFDFTPLLSVPYVLLVAADSPLADAASPPDPSQLAELTLIGHHRESAHARIDGALRARGVEPRYAFRSDIDRAVQALVAAGIGAAILPRLSVDEADVRTVIVELGELIPPRMLALYWHTDRRRPPAVDAFLDVAALVCKDLATEAAPPALAA